MMPTQFKVSIIVCSDRAYMGIYEDQSSPAIIKWCDKNNIAVIKQQLIPDDINVLQNQILNFLEEVDFVIVCGGTGIGPKDITPQALCKIADYEIPGIGEMIRCESLKYSINAYLSRCGGWVKNHKLILALSGHPKAVIEQLEIVKPLISNIMDALKGKCKHPRHEYKE